MRQVHSKHLARLVLNKTTDMSFIVVAREKVENVNASIGRGTNERTVLSVRSSLSASIS